MAGAAAPPLNRISGTRAMWPFDPPTDRAPTAWWLWGFWIYVGAAVLVFAVSVQAPAPVERDGRRSRVRRERLGGLVSRPRIASARTPPGTSSPIREAA